MRIWKGVPLFLYSLTFQAIILYSLYFFYNYAQFFLFYHFIIFYSLFCMSMIVLYSLYYVFFFHSVNPHPHPLINSEKAWLILSYHSYWITVLAVKVPNQCHINQLCLFGCLILFCQYNKTIFKNNYHTVGRFIKL